MVHPSGTGWEGIVSDVEQRVAQLEATVQRLLQLLLSKGDITVNDARTVHGLKPFDFLAPGDAPK